MSGIIGTEWLNSNSLRNYPLSQLATQQSNNSSFEMPNELFVDMKLAVPYIPGLKPSGFYVSSITVYPQGFVFEIGYNGDFQAPSIAVSSPVAFTGFSQNTSVNIKGISSNSIYDFSQISGVAVIGDVSKVQEAVGTITFNLEASRLESTVVNFGVKRISGIRVVNSGFTTPVMAGQISLQSGSNHSIAVTSFSDYSSLRLNAVDGGGLAETCDCNDIELSPCIRTINGLQGDAQGNVTIVGGDCVSVVNTAEGITISDTCAKPCCGCNELQVVVTDTENLNSRLTELALQITQLAGSVAELQNVCLSSSIDPTSCGQDGG
jgi:TolB-like protein